MSQVKSLKNRKMKSTKIWGPQVKQHGQNGRRGDFTLDFILGRFHPEIFFIFFLSFGNFYIIFGVTLPRRFFSNKTLFSEDTRCPFRIFCYVLAILPSNHSVALKKIFLGAVSYVTSGGGVMSFCGTTVTKG